MKKFILIFASTIFILPFLNYRENLSLLEENTFITQIEDLEDISIGKP